MQIELLSDDLTYAERKAALEKAHLGLAKSARSISGYTIAGHIIRFVPIKAVPGKSHRVIIDNVAKDWLSDKAKINRRNAAYYLVKHLINNGKDF